MNITALMAAGTLVAMLFPLTSMPAAAQEAPAIKQPRRAEKEPEAKDLTKSPQVMVMLQGFEYSPDSIVVKKGTTLRFVNTDPVLHTVTPSWSEGFHDIAGLTRGESASVKVEKTGSFEYHCEIHPHMKGKITVVE